MNDTWAKEEHHPKLSRSLTFRGDNGHVHVRAEYHDGGKTDKVNVKLSADDVAGLRRWLREWERGTGGRGQWLPTARQWQALQVLSEVWQDRDCYPVLRLHGASLRVLQKKGMAEPRVDETKPMARGRRMWRLTARGLEAKRRHVGGAS